MTDLTRPSHTRYTHEMADGELVVIWSNPDAPSIADLVAGNRVGETLPCPNPTDPKGCDPDGCPGNFEIVVGADGIDLDDFVTELRESCHGTSRCATCKEPLYGIVGDGDSRSKREGKLP